MERPFVLTDPERQTLRAICDAVVPAVDDPEPDPDLRSFLARRGSDLDLPHVIEAGLADVPAHTAAQFRQVLRTMGSPALNLVLAGRPRAIAAMTPAEAGAYLRAWGRSRLPLKRAAFMALKHLVTFLFYSAHARGAPNPNWAAIGFPGTLTVPPSQPRPITPLRVTGDARIDTDVCVIGSGAGGSVAAAMLAQAGRQVLLLERGGYYARADYTGDEYEMLQHLALGKGLFATADNAVGLLAATCLGGSTVVNWCTSLRPPQDVREEWERRHGIDGIAGTEFDAALATVEHRLHVNTRESRHNPNNQALVDGATALGYRVETVPRNVRGCGDCGPCAYGCAQGAKQDALVTYVQDAADAGAEVLVRCAAERIITDRGAVAGVEAHLTDPISGRRHPVAIRCRTVVLAGGAIFSPALLLRSGLGNGMVGRGLRLHPVTAGLGVYDHPVRLWGGTPQSAVCTEFTRLRGMHGFSIEAAPAHPGLAAMGFPWIDGLDHKRMMTRLAHTAASIVLTRDTTSGRVGVTARGDPVVYYALDGAARDLLARGVIEIAKIHLAAGAQEVASLHTGGIRVRRDEPQAVQRFAEAVTRAGIRSNAQALFSAHLMGSLPMGRDPRRAAVDPGGQLYGVRNLFVADASLFPTAPGVNPMITIMAMARRVANRIQSAPA